MADMMFTGRVYKAEEGERIGLSQYLVTEGQALDKPETISAFVARHGVDPVKFMAMFNSFAVQTKCKQARSLADAYKIDGVPTLGIAGRYFTSVSLNGSHERTLATTNFLINLSRKGR